jgi:hypothetical protein
MRLSNLGAILGCAAGCGSSSAPLSSATDGGASDAASATEASSDGAAPGPSDGAAPEASHGSGDGGNVLDCAWAAGDNCWKATLMPALSCLPPSLPRGTMSADGATCTYASGTTIAFQPPLMVGPNATLSRFTVTTGGATCLSYAENASSTGASVTTQVGTVALVGDSANQSLSVVCPDGSTYTGAAASLANCPGGIPSFDLGYGGSGPVDGGISHGHFSVTLNDTGTPNGNRVFDCAN